MLRTSGKAAGIAGRGVAASAALTIASVLLLTACGHNDSTASSTPTLKASTTTAAPSPSPSPAPEPSAAEAPPATTTTNEQPQPVQTTPSPPAPKLTGKDQAFLDGLKARGVTPSSPDIPLAVANYVCQAKSSGVSDQEIQTYVNAMAGQDPSYDPNKMPIAQLGQIYTDVANQTYCNK